jgi:choline-sulfatase
MYEEAVAVPLIVAGPGIPKGAVVKTPANIIDVYPFIMETVGECDAKTVPDDVPGTSLTKLIAGADPDRVSFSEYHAMGSKKAAFMLRKGDWKLVHYVGYPPQFFNLKDDPEELNDRAEDPACEQVHRALMDELLRICDPDSVDKAARVRQAEMIDLNGGKKPIIERGDLGFSMPPGVKPVFN